MFLDGIKNGHNLSDPDVTVELEDDLETKPLMEQSELPCYVVLFVIITRFRQRFTYSHLIF